MLRLYNTTDQESPYIKLKMLEEQYRKGLISTHEFQNQHQYLIQQTMRWAKKVLMK